LEFPAINPANVAERDEFRCNKHRQRNKTAFFDNKSDEKIRLPNEVLSL
jgi:hypothetical protein